MSVGSEGKGGEGKGVSVVSGGVVYWGECG